jgi:hypothetical protein
MRTYIYKVILALTFLAVSQTAIADEMDFSQFLQSDETSAQTIDYGLLSALYKNTVLDLGLSARIKSPDASTMMGTSLKTYRDRWTFYEGARVAFSELQKSENQATLNNLRRQLQGLPSAVSLASLSKNEQIAYWLNIYNLGLIEKLASRTSGRIQDGLYKDNSILDEKFITVTGVNLSLNDIQYNIVYKLNERANPLLMYGFFQGVIGSPKIRREAYSGPTIYEQLADNANEFINSNRGTKWGNKLEISWYYQHNQMLFPNFQKDLKNHLKKYLSEPMNSELTREKELHPVLTSFNRADYSGGETTKGLGHNLWEDEDEQLGPKDVLNKYIEERAGISK